MKETFRLSEQDRSEFSHIYESEIGSVAVNGQCLAPQEDFDAAAHVALRENVLKPLRQLPGAYSFIVQKAGTGVVDIDPAGQFPFFWVPGDGYTHLSTDPSTLGNNVNAAFLAAYIARSDEIVSGQSAFRGVGKLGGGKTAHFTGSQLSTVNEVAIAADPAYSMAEASHTLSEALLEAIELRMKLGKVITSHCSGGFDSSALALLLAERASNGVDAFFHQTSGLSSGDLPYAQLVADSHPGLRLHVLDLCDSELPYQQLDQFTTSDAPSPLTVFNARYRAEFNHIRHHGGQLHLSGDGGDAVLDAPFSYLADLAKQGNDVALEAACQAYGRVLYGSPASYRAYAQRGAGRTLADDLRLLAMHLTGSHEASDIPLEDNLFWLQASSGGIDFLTKTVRRELSELAEEAATSNTLSPETGIADLESMRSLRCSGDAQRGLKLFASGLGIDSHAPYLDRNIVQACLKLPASLRAVPGIFKPLISNALPDLLPPALQNRKSKGNYINVHFRGLRRARDQLIELFTKDCQLADLGVIEPRRVLEEIACTDMGLEKAPLSLYRTVAAEVWLRKRSGTLALSAAMPDQRTSSRPIKVQHTSISGDWHVPTNIHPLLHDGGVVYLNSRSGKWVVRNRTEAVIALQAAKLLETAGADLDWPELYESQTPTKIAEVLNVLARDGLLRPGANNHETVFVKADNETRHGVSPVGSLVVRRESAPPRPIPAHIESAVFDGLKEAIRLTREPFSFEEMTNYLRAARQGAAPATDEQARYIAETIYQVENTFKGRVACLERTVAVVLAAAQLGKHIDMRLGVAVDSIGFHAWAEVDGKPIELEGEEPTARFYGVIKI